MPGLSELVAKIPKVGENPVGFVQGVTTVAASNAMVQQFTGGDPGPNLLSCVLNVVAQPIKEIPWINERYWLPLILLVVGMLVGWIVWADHAKAILDGGAAAWNSLINYRGLKVAGISPFAPTSPQNSKHWS